MPVPGGEAVQRRRGFTACRICGREMRQPIMAINGLVFCPEHAREFKRRRHEGVSTAELDTGPLEDELFQLLAGLQSINRQDDVLAHYQHEYDEDLQRLRSRFGR